MRRKAGAAGIAVPFPSLRQTSDLDKPRHRLIHGKENHRRIGFSDSYISQSESSTLGRADPIGAVRATYHKRYRCIVSPAIPWCLTGPRSASSGGLSCPLSNLPPGNSSQFWRLVSHSFFPALMRLVNKVHRTTIAPRNKKKRTNPRSKNFGS